MAVTVDLSKTKALREITKPRSPVMVRFKKTAAQEYRSELYQRFDRFSRGQGNWKNTQRRRAGKTKFILRKTHTLFKSLSPRFRRLPGQYQRLTGNRIEVGIKGGKHPEAKISVGRLAQIHNSGEGRMPKRQIFVQPTAGLKKKWKTRLEKIPSGIR